MPFLTVEGVPALVRARLRACLSRVPFWLSAQLRGVAAPPPLVRPVDWNDGKPLLARKLDCFFVAFFLFALFFAVFLDCINMMVPTGKITEDDLRALKWPPRLFRDLFVFWGRLADDLLLANPLWLQILCAYSPLLYAPFYMFAIYGMVKQRPWTPVLCVVWATALVSTMIPLFAEALVGQTPSQRPGVFLAAYGGYLVVPLLVMRRFWPVLENAVANANRKRVKIG